MDSLEKAEKKQIDSKKTLNIVIIVILFVFAAAVIIVLSIFLARRLKYSVSNSLIPLTELKFDKKERQKYDKKYSNKSEFTEPSIFVAISSYRDPELCVTLQDMMEKAYRPNRIFVGVVEQNGNQNGIFHHFSDLFYFDPKDPLSSHSKNSGLSQKNLRTIVLHFKDAKGPTYARSLCEGLFRNEDYYMMTDSHIRFEAGWDVDLIEMVKKVFYFCFSTKYYKS